MFAPARTGIDKVTTQFMPLSYRLSRPCGIRPPSEPTAIVARESKKGAAG